MYYWVRDFEARKNVGLFDVLRIICMRHELPAGFEELVNRCLLVLNGPWDIVAIPSG